MVTAAVARLDDLDNALSAPSIDPAAVTSAVAQATAACASCHRAFRVQDPTTKAYAIKPGAIAEKVE
jgi:cytochrome c556